MSIRSVNKEFRAKDESKLWPILGSFNATERAIKRARKLIQEGLVLEDGDEEYASLLDLILGEIVNAEVSTRAIIRKSGRRFI